MEGSYQCPHMDRDPQDQGPVQCLEQCAGGFSEAFR